MNLELVIPVAARIIAVATMIGLTSWEDGAGVRGEEVGGEEERRGGGRRGGGRRGGGRRGGGWRGGGRRGGGYEEHDKKILVSKIFTVLTHTHIIPVQ